MSVLSRGTGLGVRHHDFESAHPGPALAVFLPHPRRESERSSTRPKRDDLTAVPGGQAPAAANMGDPAVDVQRSYWTIATRDLRNVLGVELKSREAAGRYRDDARLWKWVVVRVSETGHRRCYMSPELADGPLLNPVPGTFG